MDTPFKIVAVEPHFFRVEDAGGNLVFTYETDDVAKDMEAIEYQQLKDIVAACNWFDGAGSPSAPATKTLRDELALAFVDKFGKEKVGLDEIAEILRITQKECLTDTSKKYADYVSKLSYQFADSMLAARGNSL